ncbi:MAG: hypothetical protein ABII25_08660 [bacterium]
MKLKKSEKPHNTFLFSIGDYLTLLSRNMQEEAIQIAKNVTYRELSVSTEFIYFSSLSSLNISALFIPLTIMWCNAPGISKSCLSWHGYILSFITGFINSYSH